MKIRRPHVGDLAQSGEAVPGDRSGFRAGRRHKEAAHHEQARGCFDARFDHWHHDYFVTRFEQHLVAQAVVTIVIGTDGNVTGIGMTPYSSTADSSCDHDNLAFVRVPRKAEP